MDLCIYIPWSATGNLGAAYNSVMERLQPGEWAIFLDHDALVLTNDFWPDFQAAMAAKPDAGAIVCWTNRTGNPRQKAKCPQTDDIAQHTERAQQIRAEYGRRLSDITCDQMTGVCFAVSKAAWLKVGKFVEGFGMVDNSWAKACRKAGLRMWRVDGQYVYHQRRTNGWSPEGVKADYPCSKAAWTYQRIVPVIEAHGSPEMQKLLQGHKDCVESRRDWAECQKAARRKMIAEYWQASMRISVVIPTREEPPDELAATVKSFKDGGADRVIVIDDASKVPVADCGADVLIRHDAARGVAPSRNEGLKLAVQGLGDPTVVGHVVVFSDSHCRIEPGSKLRDWCYHAYCSEDLLCSVCGCYTSASWFYGCKLTWCSWRLSVEANRQPTKYPAGVFGSVYAAAAWTWDLIGGHVPTRGYGYNEPALSMACKNAGVRIRVEPSFKTKHRFREHKQFPFPVDSSAFAANTPWTHWLLSNDEEWAATAEKIKRGCPGALATAAKWMQEPGAAELRATYQTRRRAYAAEVPA